MISRKFISVALLFINILTTAQNKTGLVSGPMLSGVELRNAIVWLEVAPTVKKVQLTYWKEGSKTPSSLNYKGELGNEFNPIRFEMNGLEMNTTYNYSYYLMANLYHYRMQQNLLPKIYGNLENQRLTLVF